MQQPLNTFTFITKLLVILMPFYVLIKVFFEFQLWIPYFWLAIKEWLIVVLAWALVYELWKHKELPKLDWLDLSIIAYIVYGIWITLWNGLWLDNIFYGGRYDFFFLIVFTLYRHGSKYLTVAPKEILVLWAWSMCISIFIGTLVKFRFWEEILLHLGFSPYTSNWTFNGWIPNYHWLENSGIRRFSGILESPNSMWFFLILFASLFVHLQKKKNEF